MKKKLIAFLIVGIFLTVLFPTSIAEIERDHTDDVEVNIFAGLFRRNIESNIGFDICIWTNNNKEEPILVKFIFSEVTPRWWEHQDFNYTAPVGEHMVTFGPGLVNGFFQMQVTTGETTVIRRGMILCGLVILRPIIELPEWGENNW